MSRNAKRSRRAAQTRQARRICGIFTSMPSYGTGRPAISFVRAESLLAPPRLFDCPNLAQQHQDLLAASGTCALSQY
eukprot:3472997-Rhodomonas_salina.1